MGRGDLERGRPVGFFVASNRQAPGESDDKDDGLDWGQGGRGGPRRKERSSGAFESGGRDWTAVWTHTRRRFARRFETRYGAEQLHSRGLGGALFLGFIPLQYDAEASADLRGARDVHAAAHGLDHVFDDRQPQAGTADVA